MRIAGLSPNVWIIIIQIFCLTIFFMARRMAKRRREKKAEKPNSVFEELIAEIEKILGGPLGIKAKTEGCDFCFKDFEKEEIRKAFQETIRLALVNSDLKNFSYEEKEINDFNSFASAFLRLLCSCRESLGKVPDGRKHFLKCFRCQVILFTTISHFTTSLVIRKAPFWFRDLDLFINSDEKREIFNKYRSLLTEKNIGPKRMLNLLTKHIHEKQKDLTTEEFEKVLKELVQ